MPAPARRPSLLRGRKPAAPTGAAEARLVEKDKLTAAYLRERRKRIDALCEGDHGVEVKGLIRFLRAMDLRSGRILVEQVRSAAWAQDMSAGDRHLLLSIISGAIGKLREREGLPALDDPLWDQPANVFQQIKSILRCE